MKVKLFFTGICMMLCAMVFPAVSVSAQELEEKTEYLSEEEMQEVFDQIVRDTVATASAKYDLEWTVKEGKRKTTDFFTMEEGSYVNISLELSQKSWAGILHISGVATYVEDTSIYHAFRIPETGSYCVFVKNTATGSITAVGFFTC